MDVRGLACEGFASAVDETGEPLNEEFPVEAARIRASWLRTSCVVEPHPAFQG